MPVREIKTTLALDGEEEFSRAIKAAERNLRVMGSELKAAGAEFDRTGDKQAYLTTKSKTLREEIAQQEEIIEALGERVKKSADAYGEADARTDGYRIKLNYATAALNRMRRQLEETDREAEELGRDASRVGQQLSDGIGDAAQETAQNLDDMAESMKQDFESIASSTGISAAIDTAHAAMDLGGSIWDGVTGLNDFAEDSREYNRMLASLGQNAADAGMDFGFVKSMMLDVTALTGEASESVTGLSSLLDAGLDSTQLVDAVDALSGALIRFPDTFTFDQLGESLNETVKTGSATGQFAQLLTNLGYDVEEFNEAMAESPTLAGKIQIALGYLTNSSLIKTREEFEKNNEGMMTAARASAALDDAMAELGKTIDEELIPVREGLTGLIEGVNQAIQEDTLKTWCQDAADGLDKLGNKANEWMQEWVGNENYENWFGKEHEKTEPGAYAAGYIPKIPEQGARRAAPGTYAGLVDWSELLGTPKEDGKNAGKDMMDGARDGVTEGSAGFQAESQTAGENAAAAVGNGIADAAPYAIRQAGGLTDGVLTELDRINQFEIRPDLSGLSAGVQAPPFKKTQGGGIRERTERVMQVSVNMDMDGRRLASGLVPYIDEIQGMNIERMNA